MIKRWKLLFLLFTIPISASFAQVIEFDMLEMRYDQGHYKSVLRRANRLIDNPAYDYSSVPKYYKALASLQLGQNSFWLKRNKNALNDASEILIELRSNLEGRKILKAHVYELSSMKKDLEHWGNLVQIEGDTQLFAQIKKILDELFLGIPEIYDLKQDNELIEAIVGSSTDISEKRRIVIAEAKKHLGTPYKWAGIDPKGFDCSGYTSYVLLSSMNKKIDRRATDQYDSSKKLKAKNVEPGDLVFFDNGSGISHVGLVYSTENGSIQMIHASTSLGISIVDIYTSSYWKQRIAGFGTYMD